MANSLEWFKDEIQIWRQRESDYHITKHNAPLEKQSKWQRIVDVINLIGAIITRFFHLQEEPDRFIVPGKQAGTSEENSSPR